MFSKVMWATDGSSAADQALKYAKTLVTDSGGELIAVHCVELSVPSKAGGKYPAAADEDERQQKISNQINDLHSVGINASLQFTNSYAGGAAHAIADAAGEHHADVIVVGTRGHTALGGLLLGSVTNRLLHIAQCPVLAIPTDGESAN